jgi:uncharacterized protein YndB with AHSA1/START domain
MGVTVAVLIPASLQAVWEAVADFASHVEWMTDARQVEFETAQKSGVGTRLRVETRVGPLTTVDVMEVTAWEPHRRIGVMHQGLVQGEGEFRLDPVAGGVLFTWTETLHFPWRLGGWIGAQLSRPLFTWIWRRNLDQLRQRLTLV